MDYLRHERKTRLFNVSGVGNLKRPSQSRPMVATIAARISANLGNPSRQYLTEPSLAYEVQDLVHVGDPFFRRVYTCACYPSPFAFGEQENVLSIESITQQVKDEISKLTQVLHLLGGTGAKRAKGKAQPKASRRTMSAAGRKRIAAAQRARWAKIRAAKK
jgi:hypothetical protein